MTTLGKLLHVRGIDPRSVTAVRNRLHAEDMSSDFRSLEDVIAAGALPLMDRMQDGSRIADGAKVLSFAAELHHTARLTSFRVFRMRRDGIVPADIVYDYDAAHLLHSFIARASKPVFYDALDGAGLDDLVGTLVVQWPDDQDDIVPAEADFLAQV